MTHQDSIPITGAGCICAAGARLGDCLHTLFQERRLPGPPRLFQTEHPVLYPVFEVPEAFFPSDLRTDPNLLRTSRLAIAASSEALADSGWDPTDLQTLRVGVIIGTTVGSAMNNEDFYLDFRQGKAPDMAPIRRFLQSNPAAAVSRHFGLKGPVQTVVNACSSGTDAIGLAAQWLRAGFCDLVLAGGADELCRTTYNGFISLMITDSQPVRPFDRNRRGLNLGEGSGMILLESEEMAMRRPGRVRARLAGYGGACDAHHLTAPHPEGKGLKRALGEALNECGCTPADIAFVNAHGTGTPDNDRVESRTLSEWMPKVPFLSTKGFTGHTLGAAGGIEAAFTIACLEQGRIPGSAGFAEPDPELPATPTDETTAIRGDFAISQSLAFGGNNAVAIFRKGDRS